MKKTLIIAAALVLAGCGGEKKAEAPAAEGGMAADSTATMSHDTASMAAPMSSDTTMARDTTKK